MTTLVNGVPLTPEQEIQEQMKAQMEAQGKLSSIDVQEIRNSAALLDSRQMPSVILFGEVGSGKTHSLQTLLMDAKGGFEGPSVSGIEKVVMITNEGGHEDVLGHVPKKKLAWTYLPASEGTFASLRGMVNTINTQHPDTIQKMGGINKHLYREFDKLLGIMENGFNDERTGDPIPSIFKFPQNWCLWYESISALTEIAKNNAIGDKPFMELRDYQMVQNPVRKMINHMVFNTNCLLVMTAHAERENNEVTNMSELMISTVGKKLAPLLPRFCSELILCTRTDAIGNKPEFKWHTSSPMVRTKTRNLPWGQNLPPDFRPLLENFRKRQALSKGV